MKKKIISYFKWLKTTQNVWIPQLMFHKAALYERSQGRAGTNLNF